MVMTDSGKPRLSLGGVLVAVMPALLAFVGAPVLSCPPSEKAKHGHESTACEGTPQPEPAAESYQPYLGMRTPQPLPNMLSNLYTSMMGQPRAPRARVGGDRDDLEARLDRLERQLEVLSRQLSTLTGIRTPAPPALARSPRAAMRAGNAAMAPGIAIAGTPVADGPVVAKVYRLNDGKLELLTQLMVRQDVPIRVRPVDGGIEIYATEGQHGVIGGFIGLIEPAPQGEGSRDAAPRAIKIKPGKMTPVMKERRAKTIRSKAEASRAGARALERMQEQVEKQLDELHEKLDVLRERADELKEANRPETRARLDAIMQQMAATSAEAAAREKALAEIAAKMSAVEEAADALDDIAEARVDSDGDGEDEECDEIAELRQKAQEQDANGGVWYQLGFALHSGEKYDEAIAAFQRSAELDFRKGDSLYNIACGYSKMGNADQAMAWLKKAWDAGYTDRDHMKSDSDLDNIRNDARFKALLDSDN